MHFIELSKYNRWQAFASHLALSLIIFLTLTFIIVFIWYPGDLIQAGGWQGLKIVAGIDLVLGPLLTLIIYNPTKKSLPFDLAFIALIQLCGLSYGVYAIHNEKPEILVLSYDGIHVITYTDTLSENFDRKALEAFSPKRPAVAALDLPPTPEEAYQVAFMHNLAGDSPITSRVDLYRKLTSINSHALYQSTFSTDKEKNCIKAAVLSKHLATERQACLHISHTKAYLNFTQNQTQKIFE